MFDEASKTIIDKKRVESQGLSVSVNGVIEETNINPARVLFLIGSLYSLTLLIDKVFEYFMYFIHPGSLTK